MASDLKAQDYESDDDERRSSNRADYADELEDEERGVIESHDDFEDEDERKPAVEEKKEMTAQDYVELLMNGQYPFFHGPGGSGKSYQLNKILDILDEKKVKYAVLYYGRKPAVNFGRGATNIHQFFGFTPPDIEGKPTTAKLDTASASLSNRMRNGQGKFYVRMLKMLKDGLFGSNGFTKMVQDLLERIIETEVVIIDEISTVGLEMFELMDTYARKYREERNLPFGGLKLLVSGDMLQTGPVKDKYPFTSKLWKEMKFFYCPFNNIYRFKDKSWAELLLRMRRGICTADDFARLRKMIGQKTDILTQTATTVNTMMKICTTRKEVIEHNNRTVDRIPGQGYKFKAADAFYKVYGDTRREQIFDQKQIEKWLADYEEDIGLDGELRMKVGARVMILRNMRDPNVANGQMGEVVGFSFEEKDGKQVATHIQIKIDGQSDVVSIPKVAVSVKFLKGALMIDRKQFPVRAAYAATTQKVQGETQQYTKLDYGKSWLAPGVAYVGFSRAVSPDNIELMAFNGSCINVDKEALKFVAELEGWSMNEDEDESAKFQVYVRDEDDNHCDDGW